MKIRLNENVPRYTAKNIWTEREEERKRALQQNHDNLIQVNPVNTNG